MTNEMVLKNSQRKLVMPKHYVELDSDEMGYVEGGCTNYYYGWDGILQCISGVLFGAVGKLAGAAFASFKALLSKTPQLLPSLVQAGASNIFSFLGQGLTAAAWLRLATFAVALVAGCISMAATGNSKIAIVTIFGFATAAFYLGAN